MITIFLLNAAFQWILEYEEDIERKLKDSRIRLDSLRLKLSDAIKENEKLLEQQKNARLLYATRHLSEAQVGYFLAIEVDSIKYTDLSMALKECLLLIPEKCAGVTGIQEDRSEWIWTLRKGPTLEKSPFAEVSFIRGNRSHIYSYDSLTAESSDWDWIVPASNRTDVVWDGPIQDCFIDAHPNDVLFSFPTLTAAQDWCLITALCTGVTRVPVHSNDTTAQSFVWEARQGPGLGISEAGEVSYRWSLANPCRVCAEHTHGSLERTACNWEAGRGRRDLDALSLPGCDLVPPVVPGAPAGLGASERIRLMPVSIASVCVISQPRRGDRWDRMQRNLRAKGVPAPLVRRYEGVDWRAFASPDAMLAARGFAPVNWTKFDSAPELGRGAVRAARVKARVGAWLSHLEVLRNLTSDFLLTADPAAWAVVLEDGAALLDDWAAILRKLGGTYLAHPGVDLVYLGGGAQPFVWDSSRPGYVGVEAYAVRHAAIPVLLRFADLAPSRTRLLALDAHLSWLASRGTGGGAEPVVHTRLLWGGQAAASRVERAPSGDELDGPRPQA
jgi:hypothetical protein